MYLPLEKATMVINMLLEGMSVRSVERLTKVEKHTILKLLVLAGQKSERLLNDKLKGLAVQDVQADELWGFCKMKAKTREAYKITDDQVGSFYTFIGMETNSKLVLAYHVGHRDVPSTVDFVQKLNNATAGRFQLSTDAMPAYRDAVIYSQLGERVDYAQLIKIYENSRESKITAKKYSPSRFVKAIPKMVWGQPDMDRLCTSHIERLNLSIRTNMKRMARLTLSFSKKWENLQAMTALFFAFYNFVRPHKTLNGATPAMAHGIEKTFWTVEDLLRY